MLTYEELKKNEKIRTYILAADATLSALGYTDHGLAHVTKAAMETKSILETLGYSEEEIELSMIAAYLHDIGNLVNRVGHAQSGAILAFRILEEMGGLTPKQIATVVSAIGNHDEGSGVPVDAVAAALILADKSDVRRTRVRNRDISTFDIHDRVNYSVTESKLSVDRATSEVTLALTIDTEYGAVMDYFEIFLERMILCRKAAERLGLAFRLVINGQRLL